MILLDAYALVALLAGGAASDDVGDLILREDCAAATLNLAEAVDVLQRLRAVPPERSQAAFGVLLGELVEVRDLDVARSWRAAEIRASRYHRTRRPLSLADCVLLASAGDEDAVATSDPHVLAVAGEEGIQTVALPEERKRARKR